MAASNELTPLRIRGKRRGAPAERWNTGKRRKPELQKRRKPSQALSGFTQRSLSRPPKHRVLQDDQKPLEKLPAEILQEIFEYSGNIELPVVSRLLAAKLSKYSHLQHELAARLLEPVLGLPEGCKPSTQELRAATRLMNSKFMTWQFFTAWLGRHLDVGTTMSASQEPDWRAAWAAIRPSRSLLPPRKLLQPPFSAEKVSFLSVLVKELDDLSALDPSFSEIAYEGLIAAIHEGKPEMVKLLLGIGIHIDTELLRVAVVDAGCNRDIVQLLLDPSTTSQNGVRTSKGDLDLLDPVLWSWAEHARKLGNDRGPWLLSYLRALQRKSVIG